MVTATQVSFLQILIYCDIRWSLLLKQFIR